MLTSSAVNFYGGLTQPEVEAFYAEAAVPGDEAPVSLGINSRLVKIDGVPVEQVQKVGGRYTQAIERIVGWLEKAAACAENDAQRTALDKLIRFYRTGSLEDWDDYNIAWLLDTESQVDVINGFIEVYNDPLGMRGTFESIVSFRDPEATRRIGTIAGAAQWFEDHMPFFDRHKKRERDGHFGEGHHGRRRVRRRGADDADRHQLAELRLDPAQARVEVRDARRTSWRRTTPCAAASIASSRTARPRSSATSVTASWRRRCTSICTRSSAMARGRLEPGVGPLHETLKNYGSTLEEARADLVALYFAVDPKLVELGLMPSVEVGYAAYDQFIRNALLQQLTRVEPGKDLEEDHMRNRQLIALWAYEHGARDNVIERRRRDGKTFFVVNDHAQAARVVRRAAARASAHQVDGRLRGDSRSRRALRRQGRSGAARRGSRALRQRSTCRRTRDSSARASCRCGTARK